MINKSKAYIAPLIFDSMKDLPFNVVKNTYIFSDFSPLEPQLYVLVEQKSLALDTLYKYPEMVDCFTVGEEYLLMFKLDQRFNYEYLCFKKGNYSWYTPEAKSVILRYLTENINRKSLGVVDKIRSVFSRDPMLKEYYESTLKVTLGDDAELGTIMERDEETFNSFNYGEFTQVKREHI